MTQRQIKFRAWDTKLGRWYTKPFYVCNDGRVITGSKPIYVRTDLVVQQWSGWLDKNGREMYEGDLCRTSMETQFGTASVIGIVKWSEKPAQFVLEFSVPDVIEPKRYEVLGGVIDDRAGEPEIVGNVYENPDLLRRQEREADTNGV